MTTIDQSRLCPGQLCEVSLNRISLTRLPSGYECVRRLSVALADRKRQFHPDMDVTNEHIYTSLAGGMSPVLIHEPSAYYGIDADRMVSRMECSDSTDLESRANRPYVRAANAFASTAGRSRGDFLRCGGQARTVPPVDVTAVRGSQLTYCVEVAAELLADVEEQTVRSVHQVQRPGRESPNRGLSSGLRN